MKPGIPLPIEPEVGNEEGAGLLFPEVAAEVVVISGPGDKPLGVVAVIAAAVVDAGGGGDGSK